jgi:hypothetical protein
MQVIAPLKEAIVLIKGPFTGLVSKVLSMQIYKYGYLLYDVKGRATVTVFVGWDHVNWVQVYSQTIVNSSGWQMVELVGLLVKIIIDADVEEGSFITFIRSSF